MSETLLFGLTPRQIARLAAWHESAFGWLPLPGPLAVNDLRCEWDKRWNCLPDDSIALLGLLQPEMNHVWAWKAIHATISGLGHRTRKVA